MKYSIFDHTSEKPDENALAKVLGESRLFWQEIRKSLMEECGDIHEEWKCAYKKAGWTLKAIKKKRTILYLIPHEGSFRITFVLGDRAVAAAEKSALSDSVLETIRNARRYAEGTGFSIEVKSHDDVEDIKKLIRIKIEN